jgi:hypothetical protein
MDNNIKFKTMKKIILIFLPIIILSCGTKTDGSLTENEKEIIKSELQSIMYQIIQNAEIGNMEESIEPYSDSPEFMSISNGQISDYKNFIIENKYYYEALISQKFTNSEIIYTFINHETVIITLGCSVLVKMKDEQEIKIDPYTATFIFKKVNELWKVIYAHGSGIFVPITNDSTQTK